MKQLFILSIFVALNASFSFSQNVQTGRVTAVHDGDTFTMQSNFKKVKCRILHIDSPEIGQRFGVESGDSLRLLLLRKTVKVLNTGIDIYGRWLVNVLSVDSASIQLDSIAIVRGWAWHDWQYCHCVRGENWQNIAKIGQKGLWRLPFNCQNPALKPWVYRHLNSGVRKKYEGCNPTPALPDREGVKY